MRLYPELAELVRLSAWVDQLAQQMNMTPSQLYAVQLCLEELVANVVLHARPASDAPLSIEVDVAPAPSGVSVRVADNGRAFDPIGAAPNALSTNLDDAPLGGLGLVLVRKFAQSLSYRRDGLWNEVLLGITG